VSVPVVVLVVESVLVVELPLLLQDQTKAAEMQMAKESNFFFIKWFLCVGLQKFYASTSTTFLLLKTNENNGICKILSFMKN
jgi:hypothetical protein